MTTTREVPRSKHTHLPLARQKKLVTLVDEFVNTPNIAKDLRDKGLRVNNELLDQLREEGR